MSNRKRSREAIWLSFAVIVALLPTRVCADKHDRPPVPPTLEIEVLDPNVDPMGNPAVIVRPDGCGRSIVDIPPVILVHRYFYAGDRSFQGPMLPGGPSIVVVTHPKKGERCYIPVQMLPGAPVVRYSSGTIEYDYGRNGIRVSFGLFGKPKVTYRNSVPTTRRAKNMVAGASNGIGRLVECSGVPTVTKVGATGVKNLAINAKNGVLGLGEGLVAPVIGLAGATPLGAVFSSNTEDQAQQCRDHQVRKAACENAEASASFPTLR